MKFAHKLIHGAPVHHCNVLSWGTALSNDGCFGGRSPFTSKERHLAKITSEPLHAA